MKNKLLIPVIALVIIGGSIVGAGSVSAQGSDNPASALVTKIAQRFNLQESDVQSVFEEVHKEHQAESKANLENRLNQAVTDGKITDAQKQAILEKFGTPFEAKIDKQDFKNMTQEERRAKMEEHRTDLEQWASQNGLSIDTLHEILGGGKGGRKMFMMRHF